jgi:hypothetical protein
MKSSDSHAENTTENVGRTLRRRPLARKKLSEMVEEELEQMIRRGSLPKAMRCPQSVS